MFLDMLSTAPEPTAGKTETEVAIYARITNPDGLQQAIRRIEQEQYDTVIGEHKQRCRVRRESQDGIIQYTFTYKIPVETDGVQQFIEHTVPIDEAFWNDFRHLSNRHVNKIRYVFPTNHVRLSTQIEGHAVTVDLPELIYEVDVYYDAQGQMIEWCKIDIEIDRVLAHLAEKYDLKKEDVHLNINISHLPFKPVEGIDNTTTDPEKQKFLGSLWETRYRLPV